MISYLVAMRKSFYGFLLFQWLLHIPLVAQQCDRLGFSNGWMLGLPDYELEEITETCAATQAQYFRIDVAWSSVQSAGAEAWDWEDVDRVVEAALAEDLKIIGIVDYFPGWASPETDTSFWFDFVYRAGLRYIPQGVRVWEIWNEPNIMPFWPEEANVADYVSQILKPGSNAIRKAASDLNTSVTVLSAGLAPAATDGISISQLDFVKGIYSNGGADYFDALGHHPYCWPLDPSQPDPYNWFLKTEEIRQTMIDNGDEHKDIWCTELGWPVYDNVSGEPQITEEQQADYMSKAFQLWQQWDWAGPMIWYALNDGSPSPTNPEANFGIYDHNFMPKIALDTFLSLAGACVAISPASEAKGQTSFYCFPNPAHDRFHFSTADVLSVEIYDQQGRLVKKEEEVKKEIGISISELPMGIYFLRILDRKGEHHFEKVMRS